MIEVQLTLNLYHSLEGVDCVSIGLLEEDFFCQRVLQGRETARGLSEDILFH